VENRHQGTSLNQNQEEPVLPFACHLLDRISETMLSPLSFLADELKQNGIAVDVPELIQHPAVLAELSYALSPVLHEGKPTFMA